MLCSAALSAAKPVAASLGGTVTHVLSLAAALGGTVTHGLAFVTRGGEVEAEVEAKVEVEAWVLKSVG